MTSRRAGLGDALAEELLIAGRAPLSIEAAGYSLRTIVTEVHTSTGGPVPPSTVGDFQPIRYRRQGP